MNDNQSFSPFGPSSFSPPQSVISLPGGWELLKKSLGIYKKRFWVFVGIMVIPFLVFLLFFGSAFLLRILKVPWIWLIVAIIGYFALIIFNLWAGVSLLYAIKEREQKIGIKESFRKGWPKILSYWWISILVSLITMGGFLFLIIPGIIFAIWFSLSAYILVSEDIKGMNALFRSKQLIKGYWGKVFWRFLVMALVVVVITVPIAVIASLFDIPFISNIIGLLIGPFSLIFGFLVYENLKQLKREVVFEPPKGKAKIGFILIGIIGALLIPIILASIVLVSLSGAREKAKDARVMASMDQMRVVAEVYAIENDDSYVGFSCSHPPEATNLCDYIAKELGEKPTIYSSQDAYCLYVRLLSGEYYCLDSTGAAKKTTVYPGRTGYCNGITFVCPKSF